jgi:uncharacterized protein YkwD
MMTMRIPRILILLSLAACAPAAPQVRATAPGTSSSAGATGERLVLQRINEARTRGGCAALAWDDRAAAVARAHSADMSRRGYFNHVSPEGSQPAQRLTAAGIAWRAIAENIAQTQGGAEDAVRLWLGSRGHRDNLMNCAYTHTGVGESGGNWTQVFFTPMPGQ